MLRDLCFRCIGTRSRRALRATGTLAAIFAIGATAAQDALAGSVSGVCPDGSIYIVQDTAAIPCKGSKRMSPSETPPMRPDYLPRPYTWHVYNEAQDPNNPYNALDSARQVRALRENGAPQGLAGEGSRRREEWSAGAPVASGPAPVGAPHPQSRAGAGPRDLGLTDGELRDLFFIVELSQDKAPASFVREKASGEETLRVSLARSEAFERRLHESWAQSGGAVSNRVLLFSAVAKRADRFDANFTLTQGHLALQADPNDPRQLAVLQGHLGALQRDEVVLGYLVLPDGMDTSRPIDVYMDDRRVSATFD
jgi:hypothetical protein